MKQEIDKEQFCSSFNRLLGRTPVIDVHVYYQLLRVAESSGYNTKEIKNNKIKYIFYGL